MYTNFSPNLPTLINFLPYLALYSGTLIITTVFILPVQKLTTATGYKKLKIKEEYHSRILAMLIHLVSTYYFLTYHLKYVILSLSTETRPKMRELWESTPNLDGKYGDSSLEHFEARPENLNYLSHLLAYLIVDSCWMIYYKYYDLPMYFHHIVAITGVILGEPLANCFACSLLEMSNILMQARWYIKFHGIIDKYKYGHFIMDCIFIVGYFFFRIVMSLWFTFGIVYSCDHAWISSKIQSLVGCFINCGFMYGVVGMWLSSYRRIGRVKKVE